VRFRIGGGLAALLVLAVVGCGGGCETTEAAMTKAQFIKRGDAICQAAQQKKEKAVVAMAKELATEGKGIEDLSHKELDHVYLSLVLPPIKQATIELDELNQPAKDTPAEELVDSLSSAVKSIEEDPRRAFEATPYLHSDKLAYAYGFKVCSEF
jgi:hypothetical protein